MHWASEYIGKPWVLAARGPDAFDCWGLVHYIYANRYDLELPPYIMRTRDVAEYGKAIDAQKTNPDWIHLDEPEEGCVVALSRSKIFHHVGIWLDVDEGRVLHCYDGSNVIAQSISTMEKQLWARIEFYKHKDFKND